MSGLAERHIPGGYPPVPHRHPGRIAGSAPPPAQDYAGFVATRSVALGHASPRRRIRRRPDGAMQPTLAHDDIMWRTGVRWDAEGYG